MLDSLRGEGLTVKPHPDWHVNRVPSFPYDRVSTVGVVNHWDAIRGEVSDDYYLRTNRYKAPIYNIVVNRDGTVRLLAQRLTWNAGKGSGRVLDALRFGRKPPPPGPDDTSGNPWLFGVCINHHPDYETIPQAQYDALVKVNRALVDFFDLSVNQVIQHRHWTKRKSDIRTIDHDQFQKDTAAGPVKEDVMRVREFVQGLKLGTEIDEQDGRKTRLQRMFDAGLVGPNTKAAYDYWRGVLANFDPDKPVDEAWFNFVNAAEVEAWIGAKS